MNLYGTVIRRVYGEYTITRFLGQFRACAINRYQAFPPQESGLGSRLGFNRSCTASIVIDRSINRSVASALLATPIMNVNVEKT